MTDTYNTILLVEDEAFIADLYSEVLTKHGFVVTNAYDGDTGLALAQTNPYDLILLDIMLPKRSGMDVLSSLRDPQQSPGFNQATPIFILTNFDENDITKQKLLSMAQAYIIKVNVTPLKLVALLQSTPKGQVPKDLPA